MTRRDLLSTLTAAAAAKPLLAVPQTIKVGITTEAWKLPAEDFPALLRALAQINSFGYDGFETGYRNVQEVFGKKAKDARAELTAIGLRFFGCDITLASYDAKSNVPPMEQIEAVSDGIVSLGAERLILSGSPVADDGAAIDPQRLTWKAGALSRAGRRGYDMKLRVCYKSRAPEFASSGAETLELLKESDADGVHFVIDTGYALQAKIDLVSFFGKFHKRIDGFYLRDFSPQNAPVELGKGTVQYTALAAAMKKAKWTGWVVAVEDAAGAPRARDHIRRTFGV